MEDEASGERSIWPRKGTHITGQVLLLAQDRLVRVEFRIESFEQLRGDGVIRRASEEPIKSYRGESRTELDRNEHRTRIPRAYENKHQTTMNGRGRRHGIKQRQ